MLVRFIAEKNIQGIIPGTFYICTKSMAGVKNIFNEVCDTSLVGMFPGPIFQARYSLNISVRELAIM